MKTWIKNVKLSEEYGFGDQAVNVGITDDKISYIGTEPWGEAYDEVIDGQGNLLFSGFYNSHCHAAMSLFRGYGEDLPLDRWLNEKIFPAEDKLTERSVYTGTMLSIAEMLAGGIVSFSDMYMFEDVVARAAIESGIKANLARSIVSFDENEVPKESFRFIESDKLVHDYHLAENGRIRVDMSLHAEYTNTEKMCRAVAEYAKEHSLAIQMHISETEKEHEECKMRRGGRTPIAFAKDTGLLDSPFCAAHCVFVSEEDMEIMREKGVYVSHNPVSNLKLGSGVMPLEKMLARSVNVSLGTDGSASNNNLDIFKELKLAAILHKGVTRRADATDAHTVCCLATLGGAMAQGRADCGKIEVGKKADLILIDLDSLHNIPSYGYETTVAYSADSSDVRMTMVDGKILYKNGEYTTIDIEKLKYEAKDVIKHYFD